MPTDVTRVLGVDLACRSWADTGAAVVEFTPGGWAGCRVGAVRWPDRPVTPDEMAAAIDAYAREAEVAAVCLDGPQGWREPGIGPGKTASKKPPGAGSRGRPRPPQGAGRGLVRGRGGSAGRGR